MFISFTQLVLAMKCKDSLAATSALTSLGHVYTATGDYPNALASHKQVSVLRALSTVVGSILMFAEHSLAGPKQVWAN